jgi:rsbT antagonist protein RsbS
MTSATDTPRIAMQVARDVVVASIQVDLDDAVLAQFREDLLRRLQESGCHGVILDVSGLDTLDAEEFAALRHVITMTRIMGARSVLAGLRPGVVSALIESGIDTDGLTTAVDLDAAFGLLLDASPAAAEDDTDADDPDERDDESASASDSLSDAEAGR